MSANSSVLFTYENGVNFTSAIFIFMVGIFGVVCNFTIISTFIYNPDRTSFNLICLFRATVNFYILFTSFLGVFLPSTILGYSIYSQAFESWNLNLSMTLYLGNEYQIIVVALNRFCALFFPRKYSKIFSFKSTILVLLVFYIYRLAVVGYMVSVDVARGCFYFFSPSSLTWAYPPDPVCWFEDNIILIILTTFCCTTSINFITFCKLVQFYRSFAAHDKESQKRIKKNGKLFFQTVLQDSLYIIDMAFTFKLSSLSNARFWTFISGTLVWELLHSLDGFIMLLFNDRVSFRRGAQNDSPTTSSVAPQRAKALISVG